MTNDVRANGQLPMETALRFEAASGLRFYDKTLLQRALTHRSYINEFAVVS